jgi:hypothetical protein
MTEVESKRMADLEKALKMAVAQELASMHGTEWPQWFRDANKLLKKDH